MRVGARRWWPPLGAYALVTALVVGGCASSAEQPETSPAEDAERCERASATDGSARRTIEVDGAPRTYLLELPAPAAPAARPPALIISLHGHGGDAESFEQTTGLARAAASRGYATVTPDALGSPARWNFDRRPDGPDDGALLDALVDELAGERCIDPTRVALVGSSNGAAFAGLAACSTTHPVRAVVMVIATVPTGCGADRQPSVLTIRGTADTHVPFDGAEPLTAEEASRAGCEPAPRIEHPAAEVERTSYRRCRGGITVILDAVRGGTHEWPAGDPPRRPGDYDATEQILSFLESEL